MAIHPKDVGHENPRLQCSVCRRWMRLHGKRLEVIDGEVKEVCFQRFYGACDYNNCGDHLAGDRNGYSDVCEKCCHEECKRIAALPTPPQSDTTTAAIGAEK